MAKVCRWGNSLGLRLPKEIATSAGLRAGALVKVRLLDNGSIIVVPLAAAVAVTEEQTSVKPGTFPAEW